MSMHRSPDAWTRVRPVICLVAGLALTASSALAATLTTDKADYAPDETVTFSGSGWQPGEWVIIVLNESPQTHDATYLVSTADEAGNILNTEYAPEEHDLGVTYTATAHGMLSSLTAEAVFTDGPPAHGALCAEGAAPCPGTTALQVYNPTHYGLPIINTPATLAIVGAADLTGAETCNSSPGVEVFIKSTPLGNTTVCGTLSNCPGANCTITFTYTAPANGCQTTNVAYKTNGNGATNDIIDDGLLNGSASAAAGLAYVNDAGDDAAVSCAAVSTTIHNADHNPVVLVAPGTTVHDFVSVAVPSGADAPTGSITLRWFLNGLCDGTAAAVSAALPLSGGTVDATGFSQVAAAAGDYSFQASYSGNYDDALGPCEPLEVAEQEITHSGNIRACKYEDVAANGQPDDGDGPLAGWEMTLLDSDGNPVGDPQTTGDDGCTMFSGLLPGDYTVEETQQDGWFNTDPGLDGAPCLADDCPTPSKPATVVENETTQVQFGNIQGCSLDVCKYEDANANGVRDEDEAPLTGWSMTVEGVGSALTEGDGGCASFVVLPGNYTASEDLQSGPPPWFNTDPGLDDAPCLPGACPNPSRSAACTTPGGSASVSFGNIQSAEKHGQKFYDANADGMNNDGQVVAGITITLTGTAVNGGAVMEVTQTDAFGNYEFLNLLPGSYTVTETLPNPNWLNTTPKSIAFDLDPGEVESNNDFGNLCVGGGGGLTLGFWSNKNGQASMTGGVGGINGALMFLSNLNLRNANGTNFDPATYAAFRTWILSATATNMAYMLSAQLAAMELNVRQGFVSGGALLAVGTAPAGCSVPAFISVSNLMNAANASLLVNANTTASGPARSCQEFMKTALDRGNNNLNFVQSRPCRF